MMIYTVNYCLIKRVFGQAVADLVVTV
uniref:Uncharacterized protein n=1 Tax=Anguilla anguilla TaxID=7936 RepID=A0A0E9RFF8_ANGAN